MTPKSRAGDFAVFGSAPAFPEVLHVGRPNVGGRDRFLARVNDLLDRRWLTNDGDYVREFEERIRVFSRTRHAVAVCNATLGLQVAARAAGLSGEVILPSFTFVATAHALSWIGLTPVFCDVDPVSHNLDPAHVEACISDRTTGIVGVHMWGRPCDVEVLAEIARRRRLVLLFDAAHAFGVSRGGVPIGNFGDAEVVSFHATKMINSFEGGAVLTNDAQLAARARRLRNFGFTGLDAVGGPGTNAKMTEIAAAMGLTNLEDAPEFVQHNRGNYRAYEAGLQAVPGISLLPFDERDTPTYAHVVITVDEARAGISRDTLWKVLWAENVRARRYFFPGCHRHEPYASLDPDAGRRLPCTERLAGCVLVLPTGTALSAADAAGVSALISLAVAEAPALRERLCAAGAAAEHKP